MNAKEVIRAELTNLVVSFLRTSDLDEKLLFAKRHIELLKSNIHLFEDDISLGVPDYEVWRNVIGWEAVYQISNFGRIKGVESFFIKTTKGRTMAVYKPEQIRSRRLNPMGYVRTSFWRHGKAYHYAIHRLVAIHFIQNPNNYPQVLHIDDDPGNPYFKNLRWGTQSQNILDCSTKGRGFRGSLNNNSRLSENDVPKIRELLKNGKSAYSIAPIFGVAKSQILAIKHNKTWKHVK